MYRNCDKLDHDLLHLTLTIKVTKYEVFCNLEFCGQIDILLYIKKSFYILKSTTEKHVKNSWKTT